MISPGTMLLTGVNGQIGGELYPALSALGSVVAPTRADLDLQDTAAVRDLIRRVRPRWIINPAAYTAVDKAEVEVEAAYAINRDLPRTLGEEAERVGAAVIHFSTDYVFSGEGNEAWSEDSATRPLGVYGASKLAGEEALASTGAPHLILRTSWVYGVRGNNFLLTILRLAQERKELRVVADQYGSPTWSRPMSELVTQLISACESEAEAKASTLREGVQQRTGVYHACGTGSTTWFGFADYFLSRAREIAPHLALAQLIPIQTWEYPTPAQRPLNSRLCCEKLTKVFGVSMPPWQTSTTSVINSLLGGNAI